MTGKGEDEGEGIGEVLDSEAPVEVAESELREVEEGKKPSRRLGKLDLSGIVGGKEEDQSEGDNHTSSERSSRWALNIPSFRGFASPLRSSGERTPGSSEERAESQPSTPSQLDEFGEVIVTEEEIVASDRPK